MDRLPPPLGGGEGSVKREEQMAGKAGGEQNGGKEREEVGSKRGRSSDREDCSPASKKQKTLKTLEKNRESARESRRRKKEYVKQLEEKVEQLTAEVHLLREQRDPHTIVQLKEAMEVFTTNLEALVKKAAVPAEAQQAEGAVERLLDQLATTAGEGLADTLDHHFDRAAGLMQPLPFAKFLLWGLDHNDSWFAEESSASLDHGIWGVMVKELGLSEEQQRQVINLREICATLRRQYLRLFASIHDLKRDVRGQMLTVVALLSQLRGILTPMQQAKYLIWTKRNPACMQLVNSLWKDVRPPKPPASLMGLLQPLEPMESLSSLLGADAMADGLPGGTQMPGDVM